MPDETKDNVKVFSGLELDREVVKLKSGVSRILRADSYECKESVVHVVGGDSQDLGGVEGSPAIIIEKEGDRISKIIVKCPCGRHSELICEYEEGT